MPKVSVILPVYNVENYLERCIESILKQSFVDFELIIINDGSKDSSGEICNRYAKDHKKIIVIHQENKGLSMARNKGLEIATAQYINFVDSDDYIHKDTLQILYDNLIKNRGDISVCQYRLVYEDDRWEDEEQENNISLLNNIESVNKILDKNSTNMIIAWGKLYKKILFKDIRYPRGKYHEDEFVTYKLLYNAERIVLTDAKLYYYTQRKESITGEKYSLKRLDKLDGLKEAIDFFKDLGKEDLEIKAIIRYLLNIQIGFYRIKYEIKDELSTIERLKKEYDNEYKKLLKKEGRIPILKKLMLSLFHIFPNIYCHIVKGFIKINKG